MFICAIMAAGVTSASDATPVAAYSVPDSTATDLSEVVVSNPVSHRVVKFDSDGLVQLSAFSLAEQPSFMGGGDAVGLLRSLPHLATSSELQASLSVRGGSGGDNLFEADGVRVINPMHMLGFYSAFNPSVYNSYTFSAGRFNPLTASVTGGYFAASSTGEPTAELNGSVSAGLIESHGAVEIPLRKNVLSVKIGMRHNYISSIFPSILRLGASRLIYRFTDADFSMAWRPDTMNLFNVTFFANGDRMRSSDRNHGSQEGRFGWQNLCGGISWLHRNVESSISVSSYSNSFRINEGARIIDLPSAFTQLTGRVRIPAGPVWVGAEINYRYSGSQHNRARAGSMRDPSHAVEGSVAARYVLSPGRGWTFDTGLRLSVYHCGNFNVFRPQPRLTVSKNVGATQFFVSYSRLCRFDALVEESTNSLPADFWINTSQKAIPQDVYSFEAGASCYVPGACIRLIIEGYWKRLIHSIDFDGSILDMLNSGFRPDEHLLDGRGYAAGFSVVTFRQWGRFRGRISYNLGVTRLKFDKYGSGYFPASHDRLHDLSVSASFDILKNLTAAAMFVHATGNPFTEARYGYMIGENLICEYFPHNSSRLPAYNRFDLSLTWKLFRHSTISFAVYNALANRNVLFQYSSYTEKNGILTRRSVMKSVIPSVSYVYTF